MSPPPDRSTIRSAAGRPPGRPTGWDRGTRGMRDEGAGSMPFSTVEDAVAAVARGDIVVVVDDEDRENEGDLIMVADAVTTEKIAFFIAHTSGLICVPLTPER